MAWTPELIKELKKYWKKGLTTGEIGRLIGMSKNAVVGKAHRLGLEGRPSPIKHERIRISKKTVLKKTSAASVKKVEEVEDDIEVVEEDVKAIMAKKKAAEKKKKISGVSLVDLKPNGCRWPEGDPQDDDFCFCGKEAVTGKPYCAEHCQVAYTGILKTK